MDEHNSTSNIRQCGYVISYLYACVCESESVLTFFDFVRCSVDENVERPHHAGDGDDVEGDRTHDLPSLARRHL